MEQMICSRVTRAALAKLLFIALLLVLAVYYWCCWYILEAIITPVRKEHGQTPLEQGFTKVEALSFRSTHDGILLKGWLVPSTGDRAIVLLHGIHSHSWDCQAPDLVRAYSDAGFHVLLFDLRGHGKSEGDNVGLGWLERGDVRAAVDLLRLRGFKPGKIGIHGSSYGAAVAILAAASIPEVGAVIADSAFADVRDVIGGEIQRQTGLQEDFEKILMPGINFLAYRVYSLDLDIVSPEKTIGDIRSRPILLVHGTEDPIVPVEHARRLKVAAGAQAELWLLPGLEHTEGVLLVPDCDKASPMRDAFLNKVTMFFEQSL